LSSVNISRSNDATPLAFSYLNLPSRCHHCSRSRLVCRHHIISMTPRCCCRKMRTLT
jgi:hypothetical protein